MSHSTSLEQRVSGLLSASHIGRLPQAEQDFIRACSRFCMPARAIYLATIRLRAWDRDRRHLREQLPGLTELELQFAFECLDQGDSVEDVANIILAARGRRSYAIRLSRQYPSGEHRYVVK